MSECRRIKLSDYFTIEGMLHIADCEYCQSAVGDDITALAKSLKRMADVT